MKRAASIVALVAALGYASGAVAGFLPDSMIGNPEKLSKERQEKAAKEKQALTEKARRKARAERQQVALARRQIILMKRERKTVIGAPDYSKSVAHVPRQRKPKK